MMKKYFGRLIALSLVLAVLAGVTMVPAGATDGIADDKWFRCSELKAQVQDAQERKSAAHDMAEAARALGMPETDHVIVLAKSIWNEANEQEEVAQGELTKLDCNAHVYSYELFKPTHLTAEAFDYLLVGSKLAGHGKDFVELEGAYQVNGLFAMAVAKTESGLGRSALAIKKNNYYGMLGNSFDNVHDGILAFGKLMNRSSYHGKSLEAIAKTYCPPTASAWASTVSSLMRTYWGKLS